MENKGNISDYRSKLEKTLTSPDLTNDETIRTLVKNQILQSPLSELQDCNEHVIERRCKEVSNFLSMLRSASLNVIERSKSSNESHGAWKVKEDTEEFRVMYREGPQGTPFHTLLVEGYVDGPVDVCLCISSEADLYKKWWPQSTIPAFKVVQSQCLKRLGTNEQISLVRMNSWPLAIREAVIHYFTFEYLQDGLVVVILNSISDLETIDKSTHGFTRNEIPNADDVVRIDVVGGFAIQKVTPERTYFRTIANMDIKLELAPPSFINFISRQLVASGFKLFKKEVGSVSKGDAKFLEALKHPMYAHIREVLYSENTPLLLESSITLEGISNEALEDNSAMENNECENSVIGDKKVLNEIEEFEGNHTEGNGSLDYNTHETCDNLTNEIRESIVCKIEKKGQISPKVEQALETLEKAISRYREYYSTRGKGSNNEPLRLKPVELARCEDGSSPFEVKHIDLNSSSGNMRGGITVVESNGERSTSSGDANNSNGIKRRNRKSIFCC